MKKSIERSKKYQDVVGIAIGGESTAMLRVALSSSGYEIKTVEERPTIHLPQSATEAYNPTIAMPKSLSAPYAAFAIEHTQSLMRLIALKQNPESNEQAAIAEFFGDEAPEGYRIGFAPLSVNESGAGTYLACGLPDYVATTVADLLPEARRPAPASLQTIESARLNAFAMGPAGSTSDCMVYIHVEGEATTVSIFNCGILTAYRQFPTGSNAVIGEVARQFGLTESLAGELLSENQIDTSATTSAVLAPLFRQISLSTDFVSRRESCKIAGVYIAGHVVGMDHWLGMGKRTLSTEVEKWNPFDDYKMRASPVAEDKIQSGGADYTAALGAALALLESE